MFVSSKTRDRARRPVVETLDGRILLSAFVRHPSVVAEVQGVGGTASAFENVEKWFLLSTLPLSVGGAASAPENVAGTIGSDGHARFLN